MGYIWGHQSTTIWYYFENPNYNAIVVLMVQGVKPIMIEALMRKLTESIVALQLMKLTIDEDEEYPIDEPVYYGENDRTLEFFQVAWETAIDTELEA